MTEDYHLEFGKFCIESYLRSGIIGHWEAEARLKEIGLSVEEANEFLESIDLRG